MRSEKTRRIFRLSMSRRRSPLSLMLAIPSISSRVRGMKTTVASKRLRNSSLNPLPPFSRSGFRSMALTSASTRGSSLPVWRSTPRRILAEPMLEVRTMIVLRKSTFSPRESVISPSSNMASMRSKMAGWAFSASSKRTIE